MCASRLLAAIMLALLAVINVPNQPVDVLQIFQPQHPTSEVSAWGKNYFPPPTWNETITKQENTIYGSWINADCCAVAGYYLDFGSARLPFEKVLKAVNDDWIAIKAQNYSPWKLLGRCTVNNTLIVNVSGQSYGKPYLLRYWYWADSEAFKEVTLAYLSTNASNLETMADQIMGEAARCHRDLF